MTPTGEFSDIHAVQRFRSILQVPTVWMRNPEHTDLDAFDTFIPLLRRLFPRVFASLDYTPIATYGLLLRWPGSDPNADAMVLMAHYDVVPADPSQWSHPPFAAEVVDDAIWARGAVDTKCSLAAILESTDRLIAQGFVPARDVYIFSSNNEEIGGETAIQAVNHLEQHDVSPAIVLDEGGTIATSLPLGVHRQTAMVGVTEKGVADITLTVRGSGGHSSTPTEQDAPARLIRLAHRILKARQPVTLTHPTIDMIRELMSRSSSRALNMLAPQIAWYTPVLRQAMLRRPTTAAMIHTTVALTQLKGSSQINVIPDQASAGFSIRIAPFERWSDVADRMNHLLVDDQNYVSMHVDFLREPSPVSSWSGWQANLLRLSVEQVYPGAGFVPYAMNGGTDSSHFTRICPCVFRFVGIPFSADEIASVHGPNEHLAVQSYLRGVEFYQHLLRTDRGMSSSGK